GHSAHSGRIDPVRKASIPRRSQASETSELPTPTRSAGCPPTAMNTDYTGVSMTALKRTPDREFRLGLGHPVLEFLATLAGRRGDSLERLIAPGDLSRWLDATRLAGGARCDHETLERARALREAVYRIVTAARDKQLPPADDVRLVNERARESA